jgi:hypothetical protein
MPAFLIPLAAAGIAAAGGIIGQLLQGKSQAEAAEIMRSVRDQFGRIDPAKVQKLAVEQLGPSGYEALVRGDEMNAMRESSDQMGEGVKAGGMTIQDRAALNDALDQTSRQDRAQRTAVTRNFSGTGTQGLVAGLMGQQQSAQLGQRAGLSAAGDAQRRYWDLVGRRADVNNQMFANKGRAAEAGDAIARWNATNRQQTTQYNNSLEQQRYDNDMRRVAGKAGMDQAAAAQTQANGQAQGQMWAGVGAAGAQAVGQYASDQAAAEERKRRGY